MEKNTLKKLSVSAALVASLAVGWDTLTLSDAEVQAYIENSLSIGCRPIVDICSGDCGKRDIDLTEANVTPDCVIAEKEIIRVPFDRFFLNYLELGEKYGAKPNILDTAAIEKLPLRIREGMVRSGREVGNIKEPLFLK